MHTEVLAEDCVHDRRFEEYCVLFPIDYLNDLSPIFDTHAAFYSVQDDPRHKDASDSFFPVEKDQLPFLMNKIVRHAVSYQTGDLTHPWLAGLFPRSDERQSKAVSEMKSTQYRAQHRGVPIPRIAGICDYHIHSAM